MKRLNRKKIISQFEEMRQGFAAAKMVATTHDDRIALASFTAYHFYADAIIVGLGGESVLSDKK